MSRSVATTLLLVLALLGISACSRSDEPSSRAAAISTSGPSTKDLFVYGTVQRNGKPLRAQVFVLLEDEAGTADAKVGDSIGMLTAAHAVTGADGRFAVRVDADRSPTKYFIGGRDRTGLNFELNVNAGREFVPWGGTAFTVGRGGVWRTDRTATAADAVLRVALDVGTRRRVVTDSFGQEEKSTAVVMRLGEHATK